MSDGPPLPPQLFRGLGDKLYEKRKQAALEIEKITREANLTGDKSRIEKVLETVVNDYAFSPSHNARNGGLIALAAIALALGSNDVTPFLETIVPPVLASFTDQDSRVRYYACESLYNIAKSARREILPYFKDTFDALSKLSADSEISVKNAAEILDRLLKDIIADNFSFHTPAPAGQEDSAEAQRARAAKRAADRRVFNLPRFIPLLKERIRTLNPFTRQFLVQWISLLDSIPDLELIQFLPEFLDGLFCYLSDSNSDVRVATLGVLGEFLREIKQVVEVQRMKKSRSSAASVLESSMGKPPMAPGAAAAIQQKTYRSPSTPALTTATAVSASSGGGNMQVQLSTPAPVLLPAGPNRLDSLRLDEDAYENASYTPGENVTLDFSKMVTILAPHLTNEETQATALRWINEFILLTKEAMLPLVPRLLDHILPIIASDTNTNLAKLIESEGDQDDDRTSTKPSRLDFQATIDSLTRLFEKEMELEDCRVVAMDWLLMLHRKSPKKVITANSTIFISLLRLLSDKSDEVVKRDLQLLSQISYHSDDSYFQQFIHNLLTVFQEDRKLLESRGSLIIRQLCLTLNPERIFRSFAEVLEREEDLEFAAIMVQNLNLILITAPELHDLRKRVKNLGNKDDAALFTTLYRSWSHHPIATFAMCLVAQAYEHAFHVLQSFADLEMTVNFLIQIDKLVQLIESPVFTGLRLQLLEPAQFPFLYKSLYGVLMLLPQSSAFATLRNRLNSVANLPVLMDLSSNGAVTAPPPSGKKSRANSETALNHTAATTGDSSGSSIVRWKELLAHFGALQARHEVLRRSAAKTIKKAPSTTLPKKTLQASAQQGSASPRVGQKPIRGSH